MASRSVKARATQSPRITVVEVPEFPPEPDIDIDALFPKKDRGVAAHQALRKNKKRRYRGVGRQNRSRRYYARITYRNRQIELGAFSTAKEAALAYDDAARKIYGDDAVLNFPDASQNA